MSDTTYHKVFSKKTQATPAPVIRNCQQRLAAYDAIEYETTMKKTKLNRLRAAGWKVGGVREFLDLSDEDVALIALKLAFADVIRQTRQRRALTQIGLAKLIGSSQSRVAKMEAGDASVSLDLMFRTAFSLGLSASEVSRRISKPRRSRGASKKAG
jgi:DNA-binding XRE family transcriptional regulator